jgi:putative membrane protein
MSINDLPAIDASLNGLSAVFLTAGFIFIRKKNIPAHRACMISAFCVSALFLACYVTYHGYRIYVLHQGVTHFENPHWFRPIYLAILIPHETLAMVIVPLILITLSRALRERFDQHKKIARWTLPLWLYVSVTGVLVYWLLYVKFPQK